MPVERNAYDNSAAQRRDRAIERAKNTPEILDIFDTYESEAGAMSGGTCR